MSFADLTFDSPLTDPLRVSIDRATRQLLWNSETNREYQVQYSSTLMSNAWENLGGVIDGNGSMINVSVPGPDPPQRFYCVQVLLPLFEKGIAVSGTIYLGGSRVDSFDSADPNFSTDGRYDAAKASDQGNIAAYVQVTNYAKLDVYGKVSTGPAGSVTIGPNSSIGDSAWHAVGNRGIEPGFVTGDFSYEFPPVAAPATNDLPAPIFSNPMVLNASKGYLVNGDLSLANTNLIITNVNTTLYVTGNLSLSGSYAQIVIAPRASLKLYVGGDVHIGGAGLSNNGDASKFLLYGLPTCFSISYQADSPLNSPFVGGIYAPSADFSVFVGGPNIPDFSGAIVARNVTTLRFNFHYDRNLRRVGPMR